VAGQTFANPVAKPSEHCGPRQCECESALRQHWDRGYLTLFLPRDRDESEVALARFCQG
jgi:hypothetical protein